MIFSRRLTLKRAKLGGHLATAVRKIKYFGSSGPLISAGMPLEYPLGRAELSCLQSAFRPEIPWMLRACRYQRIPKGFSGVLFPFQDARPDVAAVESFDRRRDRRRDSIAHPPGVAGPQVLCCERIVAGHLRIFAGRKP